MSEHKHRFYWEPEERSDVASISCLEPGCDFRICFDLSLTDDDIFAGIEFAKANGLLPKVEAYP